MACKIQRAWRRHKAWQTIEIVKSAFNSYKNSEIKILSNDQ